MEYIFKDLTNSTGVILHNKAGIEMLRLVQPFILSRNLTKGRLIVLTQLDGAAIQSKAKSIS